MSNRSGDLILIPCCQSKKGIAQGCNPKCISDFIGTQSFSSLAEGRRFAFERQGTWIDHSSPQIPALELYTGNLYKLPGFKNAILEALNAEIHCLIISGGYGLLRPEEPIHNYEAEIKRTKAVWGHRLPAIIYDYIVRNQIRRVLLACSRSYAAVVKSDKWVLPLEECYCYIPQLSRGQGSPRYEVPKRIGSAVIALISDNMVPDDRWTACRAK